MNTNPRNPTGDEHTTASEEHREEIAIRNSVRGLRRGRSLSQRQLADALALNPRTIGYIENQDYLPSLELAYRAANFFGLPLQEVFFQKNPPPKEYAAFPNDNLKDARTLEGEPAQAEILTHLLDHGTTDERELEQNLAFLDDDVRGRLSALEEASLLRIAREPGGIFGLGGSRNVELTEDGRRAVMALYVRGTPRWLLDARRERIRSTILSALESHRRTPVKHLARTLGLSSHRLQRHLAALEGEALITLHADDPCQRPIAASLTDRGREALQVAGRAPRGRSE